jgi:hypothetical protein
MRAIIKMKTITLATFAAAALMSGCDSDRSMDFVGDWTQISEGNGYPDKITITCDNERCEWRSYLGFEAQMNGGLYGSPSVTNPPIVDGVLDWGHGKTAYVKDGKLHFGDKVFSRKQS